MGWQSFSSWGSSAGPDAATSPRASAAALEAFLDSVTARLDSLAAAPSSFGLLQDVFSGLSDMLGGLRGGGSSPAPLNVVQDTPTGEQTPAQRSFETESGEGDAEEQAPDADGSGDEPDEFAHATEEGEQDEFDHDHAFAFGDFLGQQDGEAGSENGLHQSILEEFAALLRGADGDGLAAMFAQLPVFRELVDAVRSHAVESSHDHPAAQAWGDDHGRHQWDNLI